VDDSYVGAGADIVSTNTFGASRLRLAKRGFGGTLRHQLSGRAAGACRERGGMGRFAGG
jgi:methionine synthase I (cobalamin-dependent)